MSTKTVTSQAAGRDELAEVARLRLAVVRLARQVRRHARSGVTPSQLSALFTLDRHGPMTPASLASHENISRSTVTRLVRSLEEEGLVARDPDLDDRRSCTLRATPAGSRLLEEAGKRADSFLARRVAALDDGDRVLVPQLSEVLEHLAEGAS